MRMENCHIQTPNLQVARLQEYASIPGHLILKENVLMVIYANILFGSYHSKNENDW